MGRALAIAAQPPATASPGAWPPLIACPGSQVTPGSRLGSLCPHSCTSFGIRVPGAGPGSTLAVRALERTL